MVREIFTPWDAYVTWLEMPEFRARDHRIHHSPKQRRFIKGISCMATGRNSLSLSAATDSKKTLMSTSGDGNPRQNKPLLASSSSYDAEDKLSNITNSANTKNTSDASSYGAIFHHANSDSMTGDNDENGRNWFKEITEPPETASVSTNSMDYDNGEPIYILGIKFPSLRRIALEMSLYVNLIITATKLVAYIQTLSLSVLAALLDSVLDVVSQLVLNYTERHSSMSRSSAFYPAGASHLEPIGVLTCAALMGMASFEVLKESFTTLLFNNSSLTEEGTFLSFWSMTAIVVVKLLLLLLCNKAANTKSVMSQSSAKAVVQLADPTLEALAQDHWNDALSNTIAAIALLFAMKSPSLWFLDPVGAILISLYIIHSWYITGREQIEHLTGKAAPEDFIEELMEIATNFDERMDVDCLRAYHFGPK